MSINHKQFIDLERNFREVTESELEDPEYLALREEHGLSKTFDWKEVLTYPRVILLAEAGSGKTWEMAEPVRRLKSENKIAFFLPLERLDTESPTDILSIEDEQSFNDWLLDRQSQAWFFLDAVDELKLKSGKLQHAMSKFAKSIKGNLRSIHVVISSRPSDWNANTDPTLILDELPTETEEKKLKILVLLPLWQRQIEKFIQCRDVENSADFIKELQQQDAWTFARRPMDLNQLIGLWIKNGKLGSRKEQHEENVRSRLEDNREQADSRILSNKNAHLGVERLALALTLSRNRTILSPNQPFKHQKDVLNPASILTDWTLQELQTLLRCALFDPATCGRIRFHHRSVQEYLAARRLCHLRKENNISITNLFSLLFKEPYGVHIVLPSMRPISAWLALWIPHVCHELILREPEVLLTLGDPQCLPLDTKKNLLRSFVSAYGTGGFRGTDLSIEGLQRLVQPELANLVTELWKKRTGNNDAQRLLLTLIEQGPLTGCSDIAESAAMDTALIPNHRIIAVKALTACEAWQAARRISESILTEPDHWPDQVVHEVVPELFPKVLSVDELLALVERTPDSPEATRRFSWSLHLIADSIDPISDDAVSLRDSLARLIWKCKSNDLKRYELHSQYDYIVPALALLCGHQFASGGQNVETGALIWCAAVAVCFETHQTTRRDSIQYLKNQLSNRPSRREETCWQYLDLMDTVVPSKDDRERYLLFQYRGAIGPLSESDRPWLEAALSDPEIPQRRGFALCALFQLWNSRGRSKDELEQIKVYVLDNTYLTHKVTELSQDFERERIEMERMKTETKLEHQERELQAAWEEWREGVRADPEDAFGGEMCDSTVYNLYKWFRNKAGSAITKIDCWDGDALKNVFGERVTEHAIKTFRAFWRTNKNKEIGLYGLSAEASHPGWAKDLTAEEAEIAAANALYEINGFPAWLPELAEVHPESVDTVIGEKLSSELALSGEKTRALILEGLRYADLDLKKRFVPRLLTGLRKWPKEIPHGCSAEEHNRNLNLLINILKDTLQGEEQEQVSILCRERINADPIGPFTKTWLHGLCHFDLGAGVEAIDHILQSIPSSKQSECVVDTFSSLFTDYFGGSVRILDSPQRAVILDRLVRYAYLHIRHEEDQRHEGVYTPNKRDRAEEARNYLLSSLVDTPGHDAFRIIRELAKDPSFSTFSDRLLLLSRHRAATDAEDPLSPADIVTLEENFAAPPRDRDGLFVVMMNRLEDLQHEILHHPFTNRATLRTINQEIEMQRNLALCLDKAAIGAYSVTREEEVADRKKPDICLTSVGGEHKAVIEVKIADNLSIKGLEDALHNQLVGQYLRHAGSKAGCLLLTYIGEKLFWEHPETRVHLEFKAIIDHLRELAHNIECERDHEIRVGVFGLDLRDPEHSPAGQYLKTVGWYGVSSPIC